MKTGRIGLMLILIFVSLAIVRCGEDDTPITLVSVKGKVTFTNAAGTAANAGGAIVYLENVTAATSVSTVANVTGDYTFENLEAGSYNLTAEYNTDNKNASGRFNGLTFKSFAPEPVVVAAMDVVKDLTLTSAGQTGLEVVAANYAWNPAATPNPTYSNTGALVYDAVHSTLNFEFPYRNWPSDFTGSFQQLSKVLINFDPANLGTSTFDIEVDVASINTRAPGGRDNRLTVVDNPLFSPASMFTELGCTMGTFGITANATPTDASPQLMTTNTKRYARFVSTSVVKLGDGYVAKGNVTFLGITKATDIWFKGVPPWTDLSNNRRYSGFEGRFIMNAKADYGVISSNITDAPVKIQFGIVLYKQL